MEDNKLKQLEKQNEILRKEVRMSYLEFENNLLELSNFLIKALNLIHFGEKKL